MTTDYPYQRWLGERLVAKPNATPHPNQIVYDSRTVERGQWFFALAHDRVVDHIVEAIERGGAGFFASVNHRRHLPSPKLAQQGIWLNGNPVEALTAIARGYRAQLSAKIVAITGSSGKTTVKELLAETLARQYPIGRSLANRNNEIGVPQTILSIRNEDRYAILELGARQIGDLKFLTELVTPDVALCTNIGTAHLGIFGSTENLLQAKSEIFRYAPAHCRAVVNSDYPTLVQASKATGRQLLTFAANNRAEVTVTSKINAGKQLITIHQQNSSLEVVADKPHAALPINVAAVVAVCQALAVDCQASLLQAVLDSWQNVAGRFEKITTVDGLLLIDDSYNANPDSMRCGLASLELAYPQQTKVLILGDMLELGDGAEREHQALGELVEKMKPGLLITVGNLARHIGDRCNLTTMSFADVQSLIKAQVNFSSYGEIVYLKASNGIALSKLAETLVV